jgi:SAM-dependent methyltransferase
MLVDLAADPLLRCGDVVRAGENVRVDVRRVLDEQIDYYRARAVEYDATATPPGNSLANYGRALDAALEQFRPNGAILEIACGTGGWTTKLLQHADRITALDSSPEMLALATAGIANDPRVHVLKADVFSWEPDQRYDVVFFANLLSHVPPALFETFWETIGRALRPDGRVFLVDELEDAWRHEDLSEDFVDGDDVPLVRRAITDGRQFQIVKVFWGAAQLESALRDLGWAVTVHPAGPFFWAEGVRTQRRRR